MEIEYIAKNEALLTIDNQEIIAGNDNLSLIDIAVLEDDIFSLPAAAVREDRRATWIKQSVSFDLCGIEYFKCSACGKEQQLQFHFCPWCGADMRSDEERKAENE